MSYTVNVPVATIGQSTTCLTCAIRLPDLETQQQHHKSDWHTYNLKRKVVYLPPVTAQVFAQLVTASKEQANPAEIAQPECVPCGKKYLSFQAYDNHVGSKKHKLTAATYAKKQEQLATSPPSTTPTTSNNNTEKQLEPSETVCLFCSHSAQDAQHNYDHMRHTHGFFLPASERLIDLPGMLTYLSEKLLQDFDCLWCTPSIFAKNLQPDQELHSGFADLRSVRRHMLDKGHCKLSMDHGAEREYADFYLPENNDDKDEDEDEKEEKNIAPEDSSMDMDEDEQRLQQVLLDEDGNWILDDGDLPSGIKVDPATNELVLNHRRLAHKDAVRRQKVESRTVTLAPRASHRRQQQEDQESTEATTEGQEAAMLRSQTVGAGELTVRSDQLGTVAKLNVSAQDYEATKRSKAANKLSLNTNSHGRLRHDGVWGTKV
ncbi:hypothetical protein CPC16_003250 [Podila verticillata]|nr:hypothetical protein CPC16_003250 [Podila verticillata]KAI9240793.1 MAG: C2H2 type zinc-finger-domain-containing protein [Podila humilis]